MNQQIDILLVEDNPDDAELALHALKKNNLTNTIQVVRDGAEAIDFMFATGPYAGRGREHPKVVLLDLKLPKLDGLEVLRRIRQDPEMSRVPVVILTSSREERDLMESYDLGANSFIVKPVDWTQFSDAVRQVGCYWLLLNQPPPAPAVKRAL